MAACVRQLGTSCIPHSSRSKSTRFISNRPQVNEVLETIPLNEHRLALELASAISSATSSADGLKHLHHTYRAKQKESLKHIWYYRHWHRRGTTPPASCTKPLQGRLKHNRSFQNHKRDLEGTLVEAKSKIKAVEAEGRAGAGLLDTQEVAELRRKRAYRKAKVDR